MLISTEEIKFRPTLGRVLAAKLPPAVSLRAGTSPIGGFEKPLSKLREQEQGKEDQLTSKFRNLSERHHFI